MKAMKMAEMLQYVESALGLSHEPFRLFTCLGGENAHFNAQRVGCSFVAVCFFGRLTILWRNVQQFTSPRMFVPVAFGW
jgi:hypothetical protein